jgi:hypothetical protein
MHVKILPQDHFAKRWLKQIAEQEGTAWGLIGVRERPFDLSDKPHARMVVFGMAMTALIVGSTASFIAFLFSSAF